MRRSPPLVSLAALLATSCVNERQPPLFAEPPLVLADPDDRRTLSLDTRNVPFVRSCDDGDVVQKGEDGWTCAPIGDVVDAVSRRVATLERGPTSFVTARACAADDPGQNLRWDRDCALHRGADGSAVTFHCPVVVTSGGAGPASDGRPGWRRVYLYAEDTSEPADASTARFALHGLGSGGITAGLVPLDGTQLEVTGVASPSEHELAGVPFDRLVEARISLRTSSVTAVVRPARFCGFGLGPG